MSANLEHALRLALTEARKKAEDVLVDKHTGADAKASIKDLLKISESYRDMIQTNQGASADARVMKKRYDQAKADNHALEERLALIQKSILALATEVEMLGVEAGNILRRNAHAPAGADHGSATRILASAHRIIDTVVRLAKPQPDKS